MDHQNSIDKAPEKTVLEIKRRELFYKKYWPIGKEVTKFKHFKKSLYELVGKTGEISVLNPNVLHLFRIKLSIISLLQNKKSIDLPIILIADLTDLKWKLIVFIFWVNWIKSWALLKHNPPALLFFKQTNS